MSTALQTDSYGRASNSANIHYTRSCLYFEKKVKGYIKAFVHLCCQCLSIQAHEFIAAIGIGSFKRSDIFMLSIVYYYIKSKYLPHDKSLYIIEKKIIQTNACRSVSTGGLVFLILLQIAHLLFHLKQCNGL